MKQTTALRIMNEGHNIFLTGSAGAGKSYTLRQFIKDARERGLNVAVTASSGVAATILGGSTIHSFASIGIKNGITATDIYNIRRKKPVKDRLEQVDVLIIDEISMLHARQLNMVNYVLKSIRNNFEPFGGVQVIVAGDFCLKDGTRIIMADGTLRNIEDVMIGEHVMGPDSKPRLVTKRFKGEAPLYKVDQTHGKSYTTTGNHLLALKRRGSSGRYPDEPDNVFLKPEDYLSKSSKFKEVFGGYKSGILSYSDTEVSLDPYYLGLWLGDGERNTTSITSMDSEVIQYLQDYAESLGLLCHQQPYKDSPAYRISISSSGRKQMNTVLEALRNYGIIDNKSIPSDYLYNTEEKRLQLLAGLLDIDGSLSSNRFTFSTSNVVLRDQVITLANQLGFRVGSYKATMTNCFPTDKQNYIVSISGNIHRIPTKILRKQPEVKTTTRDFLTSTLTITPEGVGSFSGIEVDGDHLFLLEDCTVLHNCQLPPVGPEAPKDRFAFMSRTWLEAGFKICYLTEQHRNAGNDLNVILNAIRNEDVTPEHEERLKQTMHTNLGEDATKLYTHNMDVDSLNNHKLNNIAGESVLYQARTDGDARAIKFLSDNALSPPNLVLKVGAKVMFTKNDTDGAYVNGTIGTIIKFAGGLPIVKTTDGSQIVADWNTWEKQDDFGTVSATYAQIPLRLAWAITVHKSQGISLDEAEINLSKCFETGQGYVALSRLRDIKGLRLLGINNNALKLDPLAKKADVRFRALSDELAQEYGEE